MVYIKQSPALIEVTHHLYGIWAVSKIMAPTAIAV